MVTSAVQQTSDNMPTKAERAELESKLKEIRTAVADMELRLKNLPFNKETEGMRDVMYKMVAELHRMERNMSALLQTDDEIENGGNSDGNY